MWKELFKSYSSNPFLYWPENRTRQALKIKQQIKSISIEKIMSIAEKRIHNRPRTTFLINAGSSGSHWFSKLLEESGNYIDCGEVYFPKDILEKLQKMPNEASSTFIDCVHLVHSSYIDESSLTHSLINSAHNSGWKIAETFKDKKEIILLIRDPVDIVISRTFRKNEYRCKERKVMSDYEYLIENIEFVKRFYKLIKHENIHKIIKYEDVKSNTLRSLIEFTTHNNIDKQQLNEIIKKYASDKYTTNIYRGPETSISPDTRNYIKTKLIKEMKIFGYI